MTMENARKHPVSISNQSIQASGCHSNSAQGHEKMVSHAGISDCISQMKSYLCAMNALCGAGTHVAQALRDVMVDTAFAEIAGQFLGAARELESATQSETSQIHGDLEEWLQNHGHSDTLRKNWTDSAVMLEHDSQTLLKCFMALMKLQCQFFTSSTEVLAPFSKYQSMEDLLTETDNGHADSSPHSAAAYNRTVQPSLLTTTNEKNRLEPTTADPRKHVSHYFSKTQNKTDSNRSNYGVVTSGQGPEECKENQVTTQCDHLWRQSLQAVDSEKPPLPPGARPISGQGHMKVVHPSRVPFSVLQNVPNLASEEEIDSIINFLSISTKPAMQTILENPANHPHCTSVPKPVGTPLPPGGQILHEPYEYCHNNNNNSFYTDMLASRQRPLEGVSQEDNLTVRNFNKTNTWPSKVQGRGGGYIMSQDLMSSQNFPAFDNLTNEAEYSRYIDSVNQMVQGSAYGGATQGMNVWQNSGEEFLSTAWGVPVTSTESQDPTKNWSANQDSSSSSDDSSNGDSPFSVGLDLVATMNEQSRRHSTSDDTSSVSSSTLTEFKHRSLDDSTLEPKSTNTWPPKSPWARGERTSNLPGMRSGEPDSYSQHARLAVQWSDPLTARHISPWGPGGMTSPFLSGSYGPLTVGGASELSSIDKYKVFHQTE